MPNAVALVWDLAARDSASPTFLRVAGAADRAAASTARAASGLEGVAARMSRAGAVLTKGLTLPLLGIGAVSVDQAAKWQKAMTLIQTAGGETASKTKVLSKGLMQIAKDTGTSLDQLGDGIYTIAKAGAQKWSAVDQLKVMKAAAQGAKAENVDLATATDALSTVMLDYHTKASGAVQVENQLIKASGLAKTNFGEFSSSLSNVVPIAAAAGLSFKEIGGAIATMTQHGVSAKQATENLRNLIFNLTGQNNVASQAMQQLGINTVDLAKNLGKRGLTGTLQVVDRALKTHTHDGMVTIDVHKAAALATKSLNTEMGTFSGKLKNQSQELLHGKVGIKDYTNYAKSLGGTAGASALQFLTLYKNSQGFSDQLKAGNGTITTSVKQYQKMLGGMTGAAVAMQIAGKYAKDNARNVREVGKAALETGSDVLGWNKTQDTLSVKMDKAKASLQVLAVEIGTALIPAVSKIVDWVSQAVHWFDGLSGTQKKMLLWSAGIIAALGPLLSIGGRLALVGRGIGTFVGGVGSRLALLAGRSEATAARVSKAMRTTTSALAGAGVGYLTGKFVGGSVGGAGGKALGALTGAASGALVGGAIGGPIGAAVGGLTGAVAGLVGAWNSEGDAASAAAKQAKAALQEQKQDTLDLLDALKQVNGQYDANYKSSVISKLQGKDPSKGALAAARHLGIQGADVTNAVLGDPKALQAVMAKAGGIVTNFQLQREQGSAYKGPKVDLGQLKWAELLERQMSTLGVSTAKAEQAYQDFVNAEGKGQVPTRTLAKGLADQKGSLTALRSEFLHTGRALDTSTAYGLRNNAVIKANLGYLNKQGEAQLHAGKSVGAVSKWYQQQTGELRTNLAAMGFNKTAVDNLIASYNKTPKSLTTTLHLKAEQAKATARDAQATIDRIKQHKIPGLNANSGPGKKIIAALQSEIDALRQGKTPNLSVNAQAAINTVTILDGLINSLHSKTVYLKAVEEHDKFVNTYTNSQPTSRRGTQAGGTFAAFGTKTIPPNTTFTVGEGAANTWEYGTSDSRGRVSIYSNAQSKAMGVPAPTHYAKGTAPKLNMTDVGRAIGELLAAGHRASATYSDLAAAAKDLKSAARYSVAGSTTLLRWGSARDKINARLGAPAAAPTAYDRLATAKQNYSDAYSSIRDAVGQVDYTTLGVPTQTFNDRPASAPTASTFITGLKATVSKAKTFASVLRKLVKEGMPRGIVQQLAAAGPDALAQARALSGATPAQLASIKSLYTQQGAAARAGGLAYADAYYKAGVNSAQGLVNGLLSQRNHLNTAISRLADSMVKTLKHKLGIHSPSTVMRWHGQMSGEGFRLGIEDKLSGIAQAGNKIGNHVQPHGNAGGGTGRHVHIEHLEQNFYEQHDPAAAGNAALRRFQAAIG